MDRVYNEQNLKVKIGLVSRAKKWIKSIKTYNKLNAVRNYTSNLIKKTKRKFTTKGSDIRQDEQEMQDTEAVFKECEDAILKTFTVWLNPSRI